MVPYKETYFGVNNFLTLLLMPFLMNFIKENVSLFSWNRKQIFMEKEKNINLINEMHYFDK